MSELRQQIDALNNEYLVSRDAGDSKKAIESCEDLYERFIPTYKKMQLLYKNIKVVRSLSGDDSDFFLFDEELVDKLKASISMLQNFIVAWDKQKSNVLQTNIVDDNYIALEELEKEYSLEVKEYWIDWIEKLEVSFEVQDSLLETQRDIPTLSDTYDRYIDLRKKFKDKTKEIPDDVFTVQNIDSIASELKILFEQMEFDIPADVAEFFKHIQISTNKAQAPLSLLTPSVLDWLKENNQLGGFTIHRKLY